VKEGMQHHDIRIGNMIGYYHHTLVFNGFI